MEMNEKIILLLKQNYSFPGILLTKYKELKLNEKELLLLIFFLNESDLYFNPKKIAQFFGYETSEVIILINSLCEKGVITLDSRVENEKRAEIINIDPFYHKLSFLIMKEKKCQEVDKNIFDTFEVEFGRTLSPIEYEKIREWMEVYSKEMIEEALKEAILNQVTSLRYIDKILADWSKKGIRIREFKKEAPKNIVKEELLEYDWLNESE